MGSPALPTHRGLIMKIFVVLGFFGLVAAGPSRYYGYGPKCSKELETITVKLCRLEFEKSCTTETKVVGDRVTYEKGECREIEVCKPVHFVPRHGHHYGKREADAHHPYIHAPGARRRPRRCASRCPSRPPSRRRSRSAPTLRQRCARMWRRRCPKSPVKSSSIKQDRLRAIYTRNYLAGALTHQQRYTAQGETLLLLLLCCLKSKCSINLAL